MLPYNSLSLVVLSVALAASPTNSLGPREVPSPRCNPSAVAALEMRIGEAEGSANFSLTEDSQRRSTLAHMKYLCFVDQEHRDPENPNLLELMDSIVAESVAADGWRKVGDRRRSCASYAASLSMIGEMHIALRKRPQTQLLDLEHQAQRRLRAARNAYC